MHSGTDKQARRVDAPATAPQGAELLVIRPARVPAIRDFSNWGRHNTDRKAHISILFGFLASLRRPSTALLADWTAELAYLHRRGL